jgi:uncharacterized protein (TIGR00159 family)
MTTLLAFITMRWLDVLDILLVALFISYFYFLVKGTTAMRIVIGLLVIFSFWQLTKALQMELVADLIGTFIGIGALAFVIIFQPEIRAALIRVGSSGVVFDKTAKGWLKLKNTAAITPQLSTHIFQAVNELSASKTGAIIVVSQNSDLQQVISTGTALHADVSTELITSIFFKNNALHDGAMVINDQKVVAAGCVLPNSGRTDLPKSFGLRHRAVIGLSESTNAFIVLVSEETGKIMIAHNNSYTTNVTPTQLKARMAELG